MVTQQQFDRINNFIKSMDFKREIGGSCKPSIHICDDLKAVVAELLDLRKRIADLETE